MRGHLVLEEEGELAAFPDAVEVAVHLVVLAACECMSTYSSRETPQVVCWAEVACFIGRWHLGEYL